MILSRLLCVTDRIISLRSGARASVAKSNRRQNVVNQTKNAVWPAPGLIRAARALAGIDQSALASVAGVSRKAVVTLENDAGTEMDYRRLEVLRKVQAALETQFGIEFLRRGRAGMGVRFRSPDR